MQRRVRFHSLIGLLVCSAVLLGAAPTASAAPCKYRNLTPKTANLAKVRSAIRCLVNRERTSRGIAALKLSGALAKAAQGHSRNMVKQHFFGHTAPDGSTHTSRINAAGYPGTYVGENIAWGSGVYATPRKIVSGWMNSSGHRANILNPEYRDTGVGVAVGNPQGRRGATYTQTFGRRG